MKIITSYSKKEGMKTREELEEKRRKNQQNANCSASVNVCAIHEDLLYNLRRFTVLLVD